MENISGITSPWVYSGMLFATFCWHVEDLSMYSLNYMHLGAAKTWYIVPPDHKEAFDKVIKGQYQKLFDKSPGILYNITLAMNPLELLDNKIPVFRTEQKAGEYILTFPRVYHCGFSHGYNVSEAVNVATPDWLAEGRYAQEGYQKEGWLKKTSFPYEWMIIENLLKYDEFEFSKQTKEELLAEYKIIMQNELDQRELVLQCLPKISLKKCDNVLSRYDANICSMCKNFCYLSFLQCSRCNKKACASHLQTCSCHNPNITMNIRFSEKELKEIQDDFKKR